MLWRGWHRMRLCGGGDKLRLTLFGSATSAHLAALKSCYPAQAEAEHCGISTHRKSVKEPMDTRYDVVVIGGGQAITFNELVCASLSSTLHARLAVRGRSIMRASGCFHLPGMQPSQDFPLGATPIAIPRVTRWSPTYRLTRPISTCLSFRIRAFKRCSAGISIFGAPQRLARSILRTA